MCCLVDSLAVSGDGVQDPLRGLGPHVGPGVLVPVLDPRADVGVERADGLVGAAAQLFVGQLSEPAFDQIQPRAGGRGEVQLEAGMLSQPPLDFGVVVGGVVVEDQVDLKAFGDFAIDRA